uniref:uncharacterized protein LOC122597649 n=1 Tax=Erigeron canadensis TaxID=72917 RepID=UPI001CB89A84|nr:uncharacterized protein LOC122597649 [Erigeron canadensis]
MPQGSSGAPSALDMIVQTEPGPFIQWIEDYPLPEGGLPKGMSMYDGKEDPDNHLKHFNGMIRMQRWVVPVVCHMFAMTLKDAARAWLESLPTGSIVSFDDLKTKFRSYFGQQRKYKKMHLEAHDIKRRDNESVRQFMTRYTDETALMKGLNENKKISGFVHGLRFQPLIEFLSRDLPEEYTTLMDRTHIWLVGKETAGGVGGPIYGSGGKDIDRGRRNRNFRMERNRSAPFHRGQASPPNHHGTIYHASRPPRDILSTEKASAKSPGKFKGPDMTKFCEYHNRPGHDTNDCKVLKGKVEEAMRSERYSSLLKGMKETSSRQNGERQVAREKTEPKIEPLEDPIMAIETCQKNKEVLTDEPWKNVTISFPPIRETEASDGPILISAIIGNHPVRRIYLDTGSGCEVMYEHCFLKLKAELRKTRRDIISPLVGFSMERSWSLGEITLWVRIGEMPKVRTEKLTFIIVRAASSYNVILGRTAMRKFGMVQSPRHGVVKFATPYGVGCIKADPKQEHVCAQINVSKEEQVIEREKLRNQRPKKSSSMRNTRSSIY